jgi:large subunit ribosomal protein L21
MALCYTKKAHRANLESYTMYAVIKTGGKQYRVKTGDVLKIEQLPVDVGSQVVFSEVLMITNGETVHCGTPFVTKASVEACVMEQGRHKKIKIIKFRRRKHHMKHMGHRQNYTQVKITAISAN